jgi:hypothetical protein
MTTREKVLTSVLVVLIAFAVGRWSNRVSTETKTLETKVQSSDLNKNTHTETVITKQKDGSEVTTIRQDTSVNLIKSETDKSKTDTVVKSKDSIFNVSALMSIDIKEKIVPLYGLSVSKEILGPITVGVFGLTNGTLGVSIGMNF